MIPHFVGGRWYTPDGEGNAHHDATTGCEIFRVSTTPTDLTAALVHARDAGSPALRALSRQQRARRLREIARLVGRDRSGLTELSRSLGSTPADAADDLDRGLLALRHYAAAVAGRLPDVEAAADKLLVCGEPAGLTTAGPVVAQPIAVDRPGVALHINGFSLPLSTALAQLARTCLAGMPGIVRPAGRTAQLVVRLIALITEAGILPEGALQMVSGPVRLPDSFIAQDLVSFTGTRANAARLRARLLDLTVEPRSDIRAEPLNCAILGPETRVGDPAFRMFVDRLISVMTSHAGQSAGAVRRVFVPAGLLGQVAEATVTALARVPIGDPADSGVRMGPLIDRDHLLAVRRRVEALRCAADPVVGPGDRVGAIGGDAGPGAFMAPVLLVARPESDPRALHTVEAFGPVSTLIPYRTAEDVAAALSRGRDGLSSWLVTEDPGSARDLVRAIAPWHTRIEVAGAGTPPAAPGRPGVAECLSQLHGQLASVVLEGSPTMAGAVTGRWVRGGERVFPDVNPLGQFLEDLRPGDSLATGRRVVTRADIDRFTELTGDRFYAHANEAAATRNPVLRGIVAHGSLVIGMATGLFATDAPGPVLANLGLADVAFLAPVRPGDELAVTLTAKEITPRPNTAHGEVRWEIEVANQDGLPVARYDLLALTARTPSNPSIRKEATC
jgi:oxepin-CoA hydrolase/3-oxo-5,6-dehydrosuberyl-CoA semialdehyde dehydrogenase